MTKDCFFDSVGGDRKYTAASFAKFFSTFIGNGVFPNPSTGLKVTANGDMTITVKAGDAWINGYMMSNTDDFNIHLNLADGKIGRTDRVVVRWDKLKRKIYLAIKKGEYNNGTTGEDIERTPDIYELALADITIKAGAIGITQADIEDLRLNTELCGIVHGVVDQVDTSTLFDQYQSWYEQNTAEAEADMATKRSEYDTWYNETTTAAETDITTIKTLYQEQFVEWFENLKNVLNTDAQTKIYNLIQNNVELIARLSGDLSTLAFKLAVAGYIDTEKMKQVVVDKIDSPDSVQIISGYYSEHSVYI